MNVCGGVDLILCRYGGPIVLVKDGAVRGKGMGILRPFYREESQVVPTPRGLRQRERFLCLAQGDLPFSPAPDGMTLEQAGAWYQVESAQSVCLGQERLYWRVILIRREGEMG